MLSQVSTERIFTDWTAAQDPHRVRLNVRTASRAETIEGKVLSLAPLRNRRKADGQVLVSRVAEGFTEFTWDGKTSTGAPAPNGTYTIQMQGTNAEGNNVPISTEFSGVVTGVDFTGSEPVLLIGNSRVNLSGVTSVSETADPAPAPDPAGDTSTTS